VRSQSVLILSETYERRLAAAETLTAAAGARGGDAAALRAAASDLDGVAARASDRPVAATFSAFADLVRVAAMLVDWRRAVLDAEPEPDRFKRSALERLALWRSEQADRPEAQPLAAAVARVDDSLGLAEVGPLCERLAGLPLPLSVYGDRPTPTAYRERFGWAAADRPPSPPELNVAFLSFTVDGAPADQLSSLTPHETHDLEIEVRVSRWPEEAAELRLTPVSIEAASAYDLSPFAFAKPPGEPPYVLRQRGRATIRAAQALRAQPFEFQYAAEFWPLGSEQPVSVVGHRTLRIESIDVVRSPITGFTGVDRRLLDLRNALRAVSPMPQSDLEAATTLATPLAGVAARAVADGLFPDLIDEPGFQIWVRDELRRRPEIGEQLEEHPHAGGGITDLSLRRIRLELKVVQDRPVTLTDCQPFVEQAAAYAVGSGKRLAVLCVLDVAPKTAAPFPAEDGLGVLVASFGVQVLTILIQGRLARPSDLSRRSRARKT
jgi:hypothetical protein